MKNTEVIGWGEKNYDFGYKVIDKDITSSKNFSQI